MVDEFDFEFAPGRGNVYIPPELLEKDEMYENPQATLSAERDEPTWRPFQEGGYLDVDVEELMGFNEEGDWDLLDDEDSDEDGEFSFSEDEVWIS